MKTILNCLCLLLFGSWMVHAQSDPTRKIVLTLQDGEKIVTHESCIEMDISSGNFYLITQLGKDVYTYDGKQRNGPFKSLAEANPRNCEIRNPDDCSVYAYQPSDNFGENIAFNEDGTMSLQFNDKKYGPFKFVSGLYVRPDKSGFVALTGNEDYKFSILTQNAPSQPVEGMSPILHISKSGKSYLVIARDEPGVNPAEMMKMDFSKMTQEEIVKMAQEMEAKKKAAGPPKAYVYSNGNRFGPYPAEQISSDNPAFCKTGGDNWYLILEDALYINGNKVQEGVSSGVCNVWISQDGKRYAVVGYDKIIFNDGSSFTAPLKLKVETSNGKTVLKWISLENEKDLVVYSKEF